MTTSLFASPISSSVTSELISVHEMLDQTQLLNQQHTLWQALSTGMIYLGILGVLTVYSNLFIQEHTLKVHFLKRTLLLLGVTVAAYLLISSTPLLEVSLTAFLSESASPKTTGSIWSPSQAYRTATVAIGALLVFLPVAHRLSKRAVIILAVSIGGFLYPIFQSSLKGFQLVITHQHSIFAVNLSEIGDGNFATLFAAFLTLTGIFITGYKHSPSLPDYIIKNTRNYDLLWIKTGTVLIVAGAIGYSVGAVNVYSGELNNALLNLGVATTIAITLGILLGTIAPHRFMYTTTLVALVGGLSPILGNAQHLTLEGTSTLTLIGAFVSVLISRLIYWASNSYKLIVLYTSLVVGSLTGIFGYNTALSVGHRLSNFSSEVMSLQLGALAFTFGWSAGTGILLFSLLKIFRLMKRPDLVHMNEERDDGTIRQVENLISKLIWHDARLDERIPILANDPQERLASLFNSFLDKLESEEQRRKINSSTDKQQQELNKLATFAEGAFEGLAISTNGIVVECNHVLYELLGYSTEEMRGTHLLSHVAPEFRELAKESIASNEPTPKEIALLSKTGERIPIEVRGRLMNVAGELLRVSAIRDMRKQREDEARILHLAQHDMLTGLPNRTLFRDRFQQAISLQQNSQTNLTAVMLLDLDRFKDINDLYGHPVGDKLIQEVARHLQDSIAQQDTVARFGGDEFAIIQVNLKSTAEVGLLTNKILEVLSKPIHVDNNITVRASASIGVALIPENGTDPDDLLAKADIALYEAKEAGRNTFCFFEEKMEEALLLRRTMEHDLRKALENNELKLHFQPQARSDTRSIVGFEALLRWQHPTKGLIGPGDFIPVAEESGLIIPIGRWVLNEACKQAAQWPEEYRVGVNLSPVQFCDEYLVQEVEEALARSGLARERLELEVTESVLIHDDRRALSILKQLKELGITIALDDFGTGYSSLSYLRRFPFDRLKIDRSFVSGVTHTPELAAIIRAVIDLGQALGMEVIAEGVETEPELELLRDESCDEVQGFLIGRPQVIDSDTAKYISKANLEIQALDQYITALQQTSRELKKTEEFAVAKEAAEAVE